MGRAGRVTTLALIPLLALTVLCAPLARASAGTWGAGQYPYLDGTVCTTAGFSRPLASWNFGVGSPAYLVSAVVSNGHYDNAVLPFSSVVTQSESMLSVGSDGFTTSADIADYAQLLTMNANASTTQVVDIAQAIMQKAAGTAPTCANTSGFATLLSAATAAAGPYTLTFTPTSGAMEPGVSAAVQVTVTGASGQAASGVNVTFSTDVGTLDAGSATTNSSGQASVHLTAPATSTSSQATITATASTSVGLMQVSGAASATSTHPAAVATAIYPAPATSYSAQTQYPLDLTPHPVITLRLASRAIGVGGTVSPVAAITGLHGHAASVSMGAYGPLTFGAGGQCTGTFAATTPLAATWSTTLIGDGSATAAPDALPNAGCYLVRAIVSTTDTSPVVQADTGLTNTQNTLYVLATSGTITPAQTLVGPGAVNASVAVSNSYGLNTKVISKLVGPVAAVDCTQADFSSAPVAANAQASTAADGQVALAFTGATGAGCYQMQPSLQVGVTNAVMYTVPVDGTKVPVRLIAPTVTEQVQKIYASAGESVQTQVSVAGTSGQPSLLGIQMLYMPTDPLGCAHVDFSQAGTVSATFTSEPVAPVTASTTAPASATSISAPALGSSPASASSTSSPSSAALAIADNGAVILNGDVTGQEVATAVMPKAGCYLPLASITMQANPAIVAREALGSKYNAILVTAKATSDAAISGSGGKSGGSSLRVVLAFAIFGVVLCAVLVAGVVFAVKLRKARIADMANDIL